MKLKSAMESLNLYKLRKLLEKSSVEVTFWGSRVVKVEGYEDSLNLSKFMIALNKLCFYWNPSRSDDLSLNSRLNGIHCVQLVQNHYCKTDAILKTVNFVTKFFRFIQELFNVRGDSCYYLYTERFSIDIDYLNHSLSLIPSYLYQEVFSDKRIPTDWFEYKGVKFMVEN